MGNEETITLPTASDFYVNIALYKWFSVKKDEKDKVFNIIFNLNPLDCFCTGCSQDSVFKPVDNRPHVGRSNSLTFPVKKSVEWDIDLINANSCYQKEYTCSRDNSHVLIYLIQLKNGKISKIGQSPSLADIAIQEIRRYKKVLEDDHFNELSKAIGLYAHGVGVGSQFVPLKAMIGQKIRSVRTNVSDYSMIRLILFLSNRSRRIL